MIGTKGGIYWNTGDEHDEKGHISEDPTNRDTMMEKRMGKLDLAAEEIPDGGEGALLRAEGRAGDARQLGLDQGGDTRRDGGAERRTVSSANFLQIRLIHPFPTEYVKDVLSHAKQVVDVEMNYSGQLGGVIREMTCIPIEQYIVKYNGRPMSQEEIYDAVKQIAEGTAPNRVVLTNGT